MMRWRPWPPRKYEVRVVVRRVEGWSWSWSWSDQVRQGAQNHQKLTVEIRWRGPPKVSLMRRRSSVKRNSTKEVVSGGGGDRNDGVFEWEEEFLSLCNLSPCSKDYNSFHPWEITFALLLHGSKPGPKNKTPVLATASLNLAEYASVTEQKVFELSIPLAFSGNANSDPSTLLHISLSLLELKTTQGSGDLHQRSIVPVLSPPQQEETPTTERDELSALKAGLRKVKILKEYVSTRRGKKASSEEQGSEGRCSARSGDCDYPFDSDSFEEFGEGDTDEGKKDASVRNSFSYGTLAYTNYAGASSFCSAWVSGEEDEDWIYYSHRKSDVGCLVNEDSSSLGCEPPLVMSSKRIILPWRKRKLNFRSPKAKGEPLLKKANAEEGGDDIDFDRRQLSSDESISFGWHRAEEDLAANRSSISDFGDDSFAVGSWDRKEIVSRDGQMKLYAEVFFATIDQRSERAAGESACTALVAVIADWFHNNHDIMPIKSQFDSLIREGSLEWRNLCENETYREKFPDKHFDLDTILEAKIRPLSVYPGKSFVGFFHPEETIEGKFDFLQGAMSFDGIWDEINQPGLECPRNGDPQVFIVSWNDHFFILKVEADAYYIIDTLGERLFEGCNQAYILKFDRNTKIVKIPASSQPSDEKPTGDQPIPGSGSEPRNEEAEKSEDEEVICEGKEACKDYIKNFLAALPIRELLTDLKKGLTGSTPLHRLQIEFHYTQWAPPPPPRLPLLKESPGVEVGPTASIPQLQGMEVAVTEEIVAPA